MKKTWVAIVEVPVKPYKYETRFWTIEAAGYATAQKKVHKMIEEYWDEHELWIEDMYLFESTPDVRNSLRSLVNG